MINSHYQGFSAACKSYGISKEATDHLYKQSFLMPLVRGLSYAKKGLNFAQTASKVKKPLELTNKALKGRGAFTAKHPILGGMSVAMPTAAVTSHHTRDNNGSLEIDTMTPAHKIIFDRVHGTPYEGFSGWDTYDHQGYRFL